MPDRSIKNGFERQIEYVQLTLLNCVKLSTNSYDFAGWIGSSIFLNDVDNPYRLVHIKDDRIHSTITLKNNLSEFIRHGQIQIDSPFFFMADMDRYKIYRGSVAGWQIDTAIRSPNFFSEYRVLNDSAIAYRSLSTQNEYKLIVRAGDHTFDGAGLIQKQIDGLFCTDGMLRFDKETQTILYTYFYRNQLIVANYDLRLLTRHHTIDTNSVAKISVVHHAKEKYSTLASPPTLVNLAAEIYRDRIFIHSNLIADNEHRERVNQSDVIDVYELRTGCYRYSFYIPRKDNVKVTHYKLHQDRLFVIRGNTLEIYTLNFI